VTAANPVSAPAGKSGRSGRVRRTRLAFRQWRRTRPFWGGLLIVLGGGEILSTTVVSLGPTLRVGLGGVNGFVGTMIAFVLALCGLLLWFSPAQRVFYSIVAIVLALATFNTINYGGFFIGMLLGIIGGALAFAWSQAAGRARPRRRPGAGGLGLVPGKVRPHGEPPDAPADGEPPDTPTDVSHRTLSLVIVPLVLSLAAASAPHGQPAPSPAGGLHAAPAQLAVHTSAPQGCILGLICIPSPKPTATGGPSPGPTGSSTPSPSAGGSGTPSGEPGGQGKSKGKVKRTSAPRGLVAAAVPTVLTASSAKLVGLAYDGVAEVPRASGGPVAMMKFTLQSVTLTGRPTLTIHQNASIGTTSTTLLSFTGNVVLYATKLSGDLLGLPITLTPSSPLSLVLHLLSPLTQGLTVTMTNVVTDQPLTTAAVSRWANFLISVRPT
jgi:Family of unknown function (DUF6114)